MNQVVIIWDLGEKIFTFGPCHDHSILDSLSRTLSIRCSDTCNWVSQLGNQV